MTDEHPPLEAHGPAARRLHRPGRLNALTDGIFAIAMTLLALEIKVPEDLPDENLFGAEMTAFLGSVGVFVVAFFITAQYWLGHHRVMSYVHTVDRRALQWALASLLGISAIPAATRLIVGLANHWQAILAASAMLALTSLAGAGFYAHVLQPDFAQTEPGLLRTAIVGPLLNAAVYVLTIGVTAGLHAVGRPPQWAFTLWVLVSFNGVITRLLTGAALRHQSTADHS